MEPARVSPTLKAVSDAVLAVAAELSVDEVLQRLVDGARELAGARYAALGLPDGEGGFRALPHLGHERRADRVARPAAAHSTGCSARCSRRATPYRTTDIHERPALPRLVAARAPRHALVPRRADRRAARA